MEFNALPSQGASSSHTSSDSKKEAEEGFEEALEKALAESGMAMGIPTFVQNETDLPLTELDIPRSETSLHEIESEEELLRRESQTRSDSDELDWKSLEPRSQREASASGNGKDNHQQGSENKSGPGTAAQGAITAANQTQQPVVGKMSGEAAGSVQDIKGAKAAAAKAPASLKAPGQLADRVLQIVTRMNERGQKTYKAVMRLRPEKLGLVEIELKLEDGRLSVRLAATQSEARGILQTELENIRAVLSKNGFDAIDMQLESGKSDENADNELHESSVIQEQESGDIEHESIRDWDGLIDLLA